MPEDTVIEEVRRIKEANAAQYDYDIHAMAKALREKQLLGNRKVVSRTPKRHASTQ